MSHESTRIIKFLGYYGKKKRGTKRIPRGPQENTPTRKNGIRYRRKRRSRRGVTKRSSERSNHQSARPKDQEGTKRGHFASEWGRAKGWRKI